MRRLLRWKYVEWAYETSFHDCKLATRLCDACAISMHNDAGRNSGRRDRVSGWNKWAVSYRVDDNDGAVADKWASFLASIVDERSDAWRHWAIAAAETGQAIANAARLLHRRQRSQISSPMSSASILLPLLLLLCDASPDKVEPFTVNIGLFVHNDCCNWRFHAYQL